MQGKKLEILYKSYRYPIVTVANPKLTTVFLIAWEPRWQCKQLGYTISVIIGLIITTITVPLNSLAAIINLKSIELVTS